VGTLSKEEGEDILVGVEGELGGRGDDPAVGLGDGGEAEGEGEGEGEAGGVFSFLERTPRAFSSAILRRR